MHHKPELVETKAVTRKDMFTLIYRHMLVEKRYDQVTYWREKLAVKRLESGNTMCYQYRYDLGDPEEVFTVYRTMKA